MKDPNFEHLGQRIDDAKHNASRVASSVVDAVEDSVAAASRVARDSAEAASEVLYDTRKRVRQNPLEVVALTFAAGMLAGVAVGWVLKWKNSQIESDKPRLPAKQE